MTFRGGHYWMFWLGIFVPLPGVVGTLIEPTEAARRQRDPGVRHGTA
jgi:hypothetical protein